MEETPTIFLVDDDKDIRTSLTRALGLRGYTVESYGSAAEFLEAFDGTRAGCLILDYGMPEMNGLELQSRLIQDGKSIPIIFITGHGGVPESVQAIKMGAVDFLEKPFRQADLIERIGTAIEQDRKNSELRQKTRDRRARFESLTDREREITQLMVTNPASVSSKEIARQLDISPRTVDHHRARILEKMTVRSVAELVEACVSAGIFTTD